MNPTPYPDLNDVLHALVTEIQTILGENLLAIYLQGSLAVGDFDEDSDVDFSVVIHEPLSEAQVVALQAMHQRIYALSLPWAQHLEGSYFPKALLRHPDPAKTPLWYLDNGSRVLVQDSHCNTVVVRWVLREKGIPLVGAPAATHIAPIATDDLRADILSVMMWWGSEIRKNPESINNRFYQTFAVLNYSRMLHDLHTGKIGSKRQGAEWAKATLDPQWHDLIDRAWEGRHRPEISSREPADPDALQRTIAYVTYIMEEGNRLADTLSIERRAWH